MSSSVRLRIAAIICVLAAGLAITADASRPIPAAASPAMNTGGSAMAFAQVVMASPATITGAQWVTRFDPRASATTTVPIGGFPTNGPTYGVLSTGDSSTFDSAVNPGGPGGGFGMATGGTIRGDTDLDVTILRIDFTVPAGVNCMVGLDFRFYSTEYPQFVGQQYNDAFIAELGQSTWTTSGSTITAPNNFAFDPSNNPVTINAAGVSSMSAENAAGTDFGGATPLLRARTPISPGPNSLFLSIFDQGDNSLDSVVVIDSIEFGTVLDPAVDCLQGATPRFANPKYIALGDGVAAGAGLGTQLDTRNQCGRSTSAYPYLVDAPGQPGVTVRSLALRGGGTEWGFQACAGATTGELLQRGRFKDPHPQLALDRSRDSRNPFDLPVDRGTDVVTLHIGAEDARYRVTLEQCFNTVDCTATVFGGASIPARWQASMTRLTASLTTTLRRIEAQAPSAEVIVMGYPLPFPEDAASQDCAALEQVTDPRPRTNRTLGFTNAEQDMMRTLVGQLNDTLEAVVDSTGIGSFVDVEALFADREVCGSAGARLGAPSWNILASRRQVALSDSAFQPTACGQEALAAAVNEELNGTTPSIGC